MEEYPINGVKIEELEENQSYKKFIDKQHAYKRGFVRLMPYNQIMPKDYINHAKRIHDFNIREDDVWISSFPKCGRRTLCFVFTLLKNVRRHLKYGVSKL